MDKLKIVLDLVRKGAITDEQAEVLLRTEKQYVYSYQPHYWPTYPYYSSPSFTYTAGLATGATVTTFNNNDGSLADGCDCGGEDCCTKEAAA